MHHIRRGRTLLAGMTLGLLAVAPCGLQAQANQQKQAAGKAQPAALNKSVVTARELRETLTELTKEATELQSHLGTTARPAAQRRTSKAGVAWVQGCCEGEWTKLRKTVGKVREETNALEPATPSVRMPETRPLHSQLSTIDNSVSALGKAMNQAAARAALSDLTTATTALQKLVDARTM
jgi:hypothetical protein